MAQARFISTTGKKLWRLSRSGGRKKIFNLPAETIVRAARGELIFGNPSRRAWAAIPAPTRRESHRVKVAAITGSNGKTTTKEITAGILGRRFRILNNEGNLNNLIGLPLSLLKPWKVHEIPVLEMGMNAPGEIRRLKAIADPQVSLITNVGRAHLEFLGSLEGVARAKGELWEELRKRI